MFLETPYTTLKPTPAYTLFVCMCTRRKESVVMADPQRFQSVACAACCPRLVHHLGLIQGLYWSYIRVILGLYWGHIWVIWFRV